MCNRIMRTRTLDRVRKEVHAPLRAGSRDMTESQLATAPIVNGGGRFKSGSILNSPGNRCVSYTDIAGQHVLMFTRMDGYLYVDEITVIGERGNYYIVDIDGAYYSILKSMTSFVRYEE